MGVLIGLYLNYWDFTVGGMVFNRPGGSTSVPVEDGSQDIEKEKEYVRMSGDQRTVV